MPRNLERDASEEKRRRKQLIEAGFELFSKRGIEGVSLQEVATKAEVGVATLYNYYKNKVNLTIAISAYIWNNFANQQIEKVSLDYIKSLDIYELVEYYCDTIIKLYQEQPELLRYSSDYKTFINKMGATNEEISAQINVLKPVQDFFLLPFAKSHKDGVTKTGVTEAEFYSAIALTMLTMAERYALGVVWADSKNVDHTKDLQHTKEMIMLWLKQNY